MGRLRCFLGLALPLVAVSLFGQEKHDVFTPGRMKGQHVRVRRGRAPAIGPYRLDMNTANLSNLEELTSAEKSAMNLDVEFKNERIYHAPPAEFAGASWDIVLETVNGRVYKVSALLALENREGRDRMWHSVDSLLRTTLGTPATSAATMVTWDTEDGNVVMNRAEAGREYAVVLTLTSRAVASFEPQKR